METLSRFTHQAQVTPADPSTNRLSEFRSVTLSLSLSLSLPLSLSLIYFLSPPRRRVHSDLRRGGELLVARGRAQGGPLPDPDLLRQGEGQADPAAGVQPPRRPPGPGQEPELGGQVTEDPARISLHHRLSHHQGGVRAGGKSQSQLERFTKRVIWGHAQQESLSRYVCV